MNTPSSITTLLRESSLGLPVSMAWISGHALPEAKSAVASESRRICDTSLSRKLISTGTTSIPQHASPRYVEIHSGRFSIMSATRIPVLTPTEAAASDTLRALEW